MDSVEMDSVQIKEEVPELEPVPCRADSSGLASLPIKQELCEMHCDCCLIDVSDIKAEHNELEIPQTDEPLPVKREEVLETVRFKREPPEVEFDLLEPGKEESEDFKPNIPELEPVRLRECSVVLERICVRERGAGEEGSPNSTQGGGKEDGRCHSECSLAGSSPAAKARTGKAFTQLGHFKTPQRTHTGKKPYRCSDCGKSFRHSENTETHQRTHTGEKPYRCSECRKSFRHSENTETHQQTHQGEKRYRCSDCGKRCNHSVSLKTHKRIHDKLYCCSDCGKCFSRVDYLETHQRIQTGQKPYRCSDCGKSFTPANSHRRETVSLL
ncbi:zinc finger and SCAN domain-containing protein 2-like [Polyodon spathula]|uniref:zinc finger and SCAN domain-containing protein 2-like n=1 Tax=Polyodon spathula TaxID=7913 RepID=UPI001B7DBA63|nr:zinc finger and SCAN domain-containing protein 2-like [Polyodon spathula]XP_041091198.1 zinc finger and SCAN domain-containing protein 2-like [Polyodon spathula]XP_041091200.1 zinc finger and SCAN domain-containing protein 2-like [Polyodon spathula]